MEPKHFNNTVKPGSMYQLNFHMEMLIHKHILKLVAKGATMVKQHELTNRHKFYGTYVDGNLLIVTKWERTDVW